MSVSRLYSMALLLSCTLQGSTMYVTTTTLTKQKTLVISSILRSVKLGGTWRVLTSIRYEDSWYSLVSPSIDFICLDEEVGRNLDCNSATKSRKPHT